VLIQSPDLSTTGEFFCCDSRRRLADGTYDRGFRSESRSRHDSAGCAAPIRLHTPPRKTGNAPKRILNYFDARFDRNAHGLHSDLKTALGPWVVFASGEVLERALVYLG
jgi:hypothetical protein